jgi:tetratricopeptide (TPR) repeat protein
VHWDGAGWCAFNSRRYDRAIKYAREALELDPQFHSSACLLGLAYAQKGLYTEALAAFDKTPLTDPSSLALYGRVLAVSGRQEQARRTVSQLEQLSKHRFVSPYRIAIIHVGLGDKDQAFIWLQKAYDQRDDLLPILKVDPDMELIHSDPRFGEMLERIGLADKQRDQPLDSLAVLPFASAGGDADAAFLGEGLCISLTNSLAQVRALKVRPFTAVARYKGPDADAMKAARELQVRAVCTGTIQKRGDDLVISVELTDVQANTQLWGEQFRRKFADLFAVQEELAKDIAAKLRLRLTGEDAKRLARRPTQNLEAFRLYTLGRVEWFKWDEPGIRRSIELFNKALEHDPNYALAYSGLADAYLTMSDEFAPPREMLPLAQKAARKALDLDPTLAEAHTSLALIQLFLELDWEAAEKGLKRALDLDPNYALAQHMYGWRLILHGRPEEGRPYIERAVQLDPHNLLFAVELSAPDYALRRYDRALAQLDRAKAVDPKSHSTDFLRGWIHIHMGDLDRAVAVFEEVRKVNEDPESLSGLGSAYALAGKRADAMKTLTEMQAMSQRRYVSPFNFAMVYTALGDKDQALAQLEKAHADRSPLLVWLNVEPLFDRLRSDPRFQDLMRRVGPPEQRPPKP